MLSFTSWSLLMEFFRVVYVCLYVYIGTKLNKEVEYSYWI